MMIFCMFGVVNSNLCGERDSAQHGTQLQGEPGLQSQEQGLGRSCYGDLPSLKKEHGSGASQKYCSFVSLPSPLEGCEKQLHNTWGRKETALTPLLLCPHTLLGASKRSSVHAYPYFLSPFSFSAFTHWTNLFIDFKDLHNWVSRQRPSFCKHLVNLKHRRVSLKLRRLLMCFKCLQGYG